MNENSTAAEDFAAIVEIPEYHDKLDTRSLFDTEHDDADISPIDQFIENCKPLNLLWLGKPEDATKLSPTIGILLILGYVSAVEGYMRALIRRLIVCDPFSQKCCETYPVSFGAVSHHQVDALPDALLEETVFSSKDGIIKALTKFVDFTIKPANPLISLLDQYESVCQLRHCCVHRFGKLGVKNAIALGGLKTHKACLEKPIRLTQKEMSAIAQLVYVLVKSINKEVFRTVMARSASGTLDGGITLGIGWTWDIEQDRAVFARYYAVFASVSDARESPDAMVLYERFRKTYHLLEKTVAKK
jgi:hypothetical protein